MIELVFELVLQVVGNAERYKIHSINLLSIYFFFKIIFTDRSFRC